MRIAVVTTSWPRFEHDPAGHFVRAEARELERAGNEVILIAPPPGGAFGWPGVSTRVTARPWLAVEAGRWLVAARGALRRARPDSVSAHWAIPGAFPVGMAVSDPPLDVVSHGGDVRLLVRLPGPVRNRLVRAIASRSREWRFVSRSLLESLLASLDGETAANVERVASVRGASIELPDVRSAVRRRRAELGRARVAACVGRLVASKRVDRVIEHVARSRDVDALVVVGDGPERARLERLARALGVDARFVGARARDEALAWIGAADVLIHASTAEGLSTVLREAAALGTPSLRI